MARIKFLIFALLGVGLAVVGLSSLSGRLAALSRVQTDERLAWGKVLLDSSDRLAQAHRATALAAVAADPSVTQAMAALESAAPGAEGAGAAALETVRKAATEALAKLPGGIGAPALVLAASGQGSAAIEAAGGAARVLSSDSFGLGAAAAGLEGSYALVDGVLYRVSAATVMGADAVTGTAKSLGQIAAAFPLDQAWAAERAKDLTLGVTLVAGDTVHSSLSDSEKQTAAAASNGGVALGAVAPLGPVALPLFTGGAPLAQAQVVELPGVEGARIVLTSPAATLAALADFQRQALPGLAGLLVLAIAFLILIGSTAGAKVAAAAPEAAASQAEPLPAASVEPLAPAASVEPLAATEAPAPAGGFEAPTASPDDFPFGNEPAAAGGAEQLGADLFSMPSPDAPPASEPPADFLSSPPPSPDLITAPQPAEDFFAAAAAANPPGIATASSALDAVPLPSPSSSGGVDPFGQVPTAGHQHEETTGSYRAMDPFALAAAQMDPSERQQYNERTVVAAVPEQLLRATGKKPAAGAVALPAPTPPPAPDAGGEDAHFLDVFAQFVATRAQCNEPADGLTQDKFLAKLRKNKEQLVTKYNCKTVRFQVYVKDGKAALKATPVKDA